MAKLSVLVAAVALAIDLTIGLAFTGNNWVVFAAMAIMDWPSMMITHGIDLRGAWLTGLGRTRQDFARVLVSRIVVAGALPMLVFLLAAEAVLARADHLR